MSKTTIGVLIGALIIIIFLIFNQANETDTEKNPTQATQNENTNRATSTTNATNDNSNDDVVVTSNAVNLSGQGLKKVPDTLFKETAIQKLDLSNNQLEGALPAEVRFLKDLKELNLSNLKVLNLKGNEYSVDDLNIIKQKLSASVEIMVD